MMTTQTGPLDAEQYTLPLLPLLRFFRSNRKNTTPMSHSYSRTMYLDTRKLLIVQSRIVRQSEENLVILERSFKVNLQNHLPNKGISQPVFSVPLGLMGAYLSRIRSLTETGPKEGIVLNLDSINDFWSFIAATSFTRKATLVLANNGDISAIWENEDDSYLDIQFLGNRKIIYVIFKRKTGQNGMFRTAGTSSFEAVRDRIAELDLMELVSV